MPAKLEVLTDVATLEPELRREIKELSEYRNRLAHGVTVPFAGDVLGFDALRAIEEADRGDELDVATEKSLRGDQSAIEELAREFGNPHISLQLSGLGTDDIEQAEVNLGIAEKAIQALKAEVNSPDWPRK
jgi:hypothetical protein